jgi:hypothetical protein
MRQAFARSDAVQIFRKAACAIADLPKDVLVQKQAWHLACLKRYIYCGNDDTVPAGLLYRMYPAEAVLYSLEWIKKRGAKRISLDLPHFERIMRPENLPILQALLKTHAPRKHVLVNWMLEAVRVDNPVGLVMIIDKGARPFYCNNLACVEAVRLNSRKTLCVLLSHLKGTLPSVIEEVLSLDTTQPETISLVLAYKKSL